MKKTDSKTTKEQVRQEEEKLLILAKTDETKGELLLVSDEGIYTENELKMFALGEVDDPDRKYELYYNGIMKLLRKFLPKGKANQKARSFIYEEKNTFLTRGKRLDEKGTRGGDSRMAYIRDIEEFLNILVSWVLSKGTVVELYNTLRNLNISKGYGSTQSAKRQASSI